MANFLMQCVSPETEFWEMIVFKILNQHIRVKIDVPPLLLAYGAH